MNKNYDVNNAFRTLDSSIERLISLRRILEKNHQILQNNMSSHEDRIDAEISMKGAFLLYENYARPLSCYLSQLDSKAKMPKFSYENKLSISFALEGDWVSHELSRFLGALNYLHNVSALYSKLQSKNVSYRLERPQSRSHIIRNARLYFYLDKSEELKINKIHISSPGVVDFIASNFEYGTIIVSVLYVTNKLPKWSDEIITIWNKWKTNYRNQRIHDRHEKIDKSVNMFFEREILSKLNNKNYELDDKGLHIINKAISEFSEKKLADPVSTMDHILRSIAVLSHLKRIGKYHLIENNINSEHNK